MQKKGRIFLFIILCISFASASFQMGNTSYFVEKEYGPEATLNGWINLSLNKEPINSLFQDSENNSIELLNLLKSNPGYSYNCSIKDCSEASTTINEATQKTFGLNAKSSKTLGFKFPSLNSINSVEFTLASTVGASCGNQLKIDFLDDGIVDIINYKASSEVCNTTKNYGCFNSSDTTSEYFLGSTPYCQKIYLKEAPGFRVGAWIKKVGSGSADKVMYLFDGSAKVSSCKLPEASSSGSEVYCDLTYLVKEPKNYYVCVYANQESLYKVRASSSPSTKCGFYGTPVRTSTTAYQIFAQEKKFGSIGTLNIKDDTLNGGISTLIENYIKEQYGSLNCPSPEGCVVPIKIKSEANQTIVVKNLQILYAETAGQTSTNKFYDIIKVPSKVDSKFQKLYLGAGNFVLPASYGNFSYQLKLGDQEIFSDDLKIGKVPKINTLTPRTTALGFETTFSVDAEAVEGNISKYIWSFSSGSITTSENKATHTYDALGTHMLNITVVDTNNKSVSKSFNIEVNSPEKEIQEGIVKIQRSLNNIKSRINTLSATDQQIVNSIIKMGEMEDALKSLQQKASIANTERAYLDLVDQLQAIDVPDSISVSKQANDLFFLPQKEKMNLDILRKIGAGDYADSDEDKYLDEVVFWNQENIESKISFREISQRKGDYIGTLLNIFEISINDNGGLTTNPYFVIENLEGLEFLEDYGQREELGYFYLEIEPDQEKIVFHTTEEIDFSDVPAFISPDLSELSVIGAENPKEGGISKWIWFVLIIIFVLIGAVILYIILEEWYKRKYETALFKNRQNLFNLLAYMNNAKRKGSSNKQILQKLRKAGWKGEQIKYAMKKFEGKNTGMWELPFKKFLQNFPIKLKKSKDKPKKRFGMIMPPPGFRPPRMFPDSRRKKI